MQISIPFLVAALLAGCAAPTVSPDTSTSGVEVTCVGTGGPSVVIEVLDPAGRPAAFGATIVIRDGAFADTTGPSRPWSDRLVGTGERRPGTYHVTITKPGYEPVHLRNVVARPTGNPRCNYSEPDGPQRRVRLRLARDASPVRSIVVLPDGIGFSLPYTEEPMRAIVDADPDVAQGVTWSSSDTTVATVSASGVLRSGCVRETGEATITAASVADPTVTGTAEVTVWPVRSEDDLRGVMPREAADGARACLRQLFGGRP